MPKIDPKLGGRISARRREIRHLLNQGANNEILDALAVSRAGRALNPLAKLLFRNASLSLTYENARVLAYAFAYAEAEQIEGDYAEFGVWQGRTFLEAWRVGNAAGDTGRNFFAFDSFAGLPDIEDADRAGRFVAGEFSFGRRAFEGRLRRAAIPPDRVHIVEGYFDDSLAEPQRIPLQKVAIAYVDCDLYASTVPVLDYLSTRLVHGAVVMFDDWFCFKGSPDLGEAKACREWLERNPDLSLVPTWQFNWAGQAFVFHRDGDA